MKSAIKKSKNYSFVILFLICAFILILLGIIIGSFTAKSNTRSQAQENLEIRPAPSISFIKQTLNNLLITYPIRDADFQMVDFVRYIGLSYQQFEDKNATWPRIYDNRINHRSLTSIISHPTLFREKGYAESSEPISIVLWGIAQPFKTENARASLLCGKSRVLYINTAVRTKWDPWSADKWLNQNPDPKNADVIEINIATDTQYGFKWEDCSDPKFDDMQDLVEELKSK